MPPKKQPNQLRKNSRGNSGSTSITRRELTGYKYSPSAGIPDSTPKPWYPIVISFTSIPAEITSPYLVRYFYEQIDNTAKTFKPWSTQVNGLALEVRFQKVEVWNLTGRALSLTVWEPPAQDYSSTNPGEAYTQLGGWTDAGNGETFPRIGYKYSFSHSNIGHTLTYDVSGFKVITTTAGNPADTLLHRFHLLWKAPGPVKYTSVIPHSPQVQDLLKRISKVTTSVSSLDKSEAERSTAAESNADKRAHDILAVCEAIKDKIPTYTREIDECAKELIQEFDFLHDAH